MEERWNMGWFGRAASEWREPDMERPWLALPMVLVRFIADGGCGMPELKLSPPRVYSDSQQHAAILAEWSSYGYRTSLGLRTLQRLLSCDMVTKPGAR